MPRKIDAQIHGGQGQHLRRGGHEPQHGLGEGQTHQGEEDPAHDAHDGRGLYGLGHARRILRPEIAGDEHADAGSQPHEQVDHEGDQGAVGAHRRKSRLPGEAAHHDQVRRIEGQLQDAG